MRFLGAFVTLAFALAALFYGSLLWRALPDGSLLQCELAIIALGLVLHLHTAAR